MKRAELIGHLKEHGFDFIEWGMDDEDDYWIYQMLHSALKIIDENSLTEKYLEELAKG